MVKAIEKEVQPHISAMKAARAKLQTAIDTAKVWAFRQPVLIQKQPPIGLELEYFWVIANFMLSILATN